MTCVTFFPKILSALVITTVFATATADVAHAQSHSEPLRISVTDGKIYAEPTESLTYRIVVDNRNGDATSYDLRTTLPPNVLFVSATDNPHRDHRKLTWPETRIGAGDVHEYTLRTKLDREAAEHDVIQLRVIANGNFATDYTSVRTGALDTSFDVHVTDGYSVVPAGKEVTYAIQLRNRSSELATNIKVNNDLPSHMEFVSASEGGYWTGKSVRWKGLTISPHGQRVLRVRARVRSDAPLGQEMRNSVEVRGNVAVDSTRIGRRSIRAGSSPIGDHNPITLRKTADRAEVQPGDTVGYTITLRNNTNTAFRNVLVEDRMDTQYMQVVRAARGQRKGNSLMWNVPELAPGQTWRAQYRVQISPHVPRGTQMKNIVLVSGKGLETISLASRVVTGKTGVITDLPPTGAGIGGIFATLSGLLSTVPVWLLRRKLLV